MKTTVQPVETTLNNTLLPHTHLKIGDPENRRFCLVSPKTPLLRRRRTHETRTTSQEPASRRSITGAQPTGASARTGCLKLGLGRLGGRSGGGGSVKGNQKEPFLFVFVVGGGTRKKGSEPKNRISRILVVCFNPVEMPKLKEINHFDKLPEKLPQGTMPY